MRALELLARRGGLLLADEVGLGKSFVAAEVIRSVGGEAEVIVPAALVDQWRKTLRDFDVTAPVLTHDGIVGDAMLPAPSSRLLVVDEAHAFRNPRTLRHAALARRTAGARVLLVTATPICNSLADLEALIRIIARDDLLADVGVPSIDAAFAARQREALDIVVASLIIRRHRDALPEVLQFGTLDRRVVRHPVLELPQIDDLRFPLTGHAPILRRFLRRRLESSEAAFLESVRRQLRFYERALSAIAAGRTLPKTDYRRTFGHEEDRDAFQTILFWDLFAPAGEVEPTQIRDEMERLDRMVVLARASPPLKRNLLVDIVAAAAAPVLIFTTSVATARDLQAALKCGLVTSRERSRDAVLEAFRTGRLDVVVSTDLAAEGLNLQRAGMVVHYDIPWNPVKLDQRNGRAHRIGQQRPSVHAIYFLPATRESGVIQTVARKNRIRRRALETDVGVPAERTRTLRPRVGPGSAFLQLRRVAGDLPDVLARRHKAGIEQVIDEMSREYLDQRRLDDLLALVASEA